MKLLGIDYGLKKIGLALGDTESKLAEPLAVIKVSGQTADMAKKIAKITKGQIIEKIIIGLPESGLIDKIKEFGGELVKITGLPVIYQDEVLTTKEAIVKMIQAGKKKKKRQRQEDAVAAAILLENYFEGNNV